MGASAQLPSSLRMWRQVLELAMSQRLSGNDNVQGPRHLKVVGGWSPRAVGAGVSKSHKVECTKNKSLRANLRPLLTIPRC